MAQAYAELKQELATRYANDREAYTTAKGQFIEQLLRGVLGSPEA